VIVTEYKNFITEDEQSQILKFVEDRENMYHHVSKYEMYRQGTKVPLFFYGSPVYPTTTKTEYEECRSGSEDLKDLFLLHKCVETISCEFGMEIEHLEGTSFPGFHIFKDGPGYDNFFNIDRYHVDTDVFKYKPAAEVYSFVVVISTTEVGDSLDYDNQSTHVNYKYSERSMYMWNGSVPHKIGYVDLSQGGKRITYQGHIMVSDKLYYYW
jgi:hypothetical protein